MAKKAHHKKSVKLSGTAKNSLSRLKKELAKLTKEHDKYEKKLIDIKAQIRHIKSL